MAFLSRAVCTLACKIAEEGLLTQCITRAALCTVIEVLSHSFSQLSARLQITTCDTSHSHTRARCDVLYS